ncbi:MAG: CBS domain-containing protein [Thermoplasmatota archaeon]
MKVKEIMTKDVIYVDKDVDLKYVLKLMKKNSITKIPVVEEKKVIGVITDNTLAVKLGSIRNRGVPASRLHASSVVNKELTTITPDQEIKTILSTVGEPGPTMLTVVENEEIKGVITKADLLPLVDSTTQVKEIMREQIYSVSPDDRVIHARRLLIDRNIARLPVINNGILIGIISDIDITFALAKLKKSFPLGKQKHQLEELLVNDAMQVPAISIDAGKTVKDAAELMLEENVGCLPVIQNEKIIGILSRTDVVKTISLD